MAGPQDFRFLIAGIDTLDLGLYVRWGVRFVMLSNYLNHARAQSIQGKATVLDEEVLGKVLVKPSGKRNYRWFIERPDMVIWIADKDEPNGFPNVYVSPKAETLWTRGVTATVEDIVQLIRESGGEVDQVQVSRCDLAADFMIPGGLSLDFLRQSVVSRSRHRAMYETVDAMETYYVGQRGAPLLARIYNKLLMVIKHPQTAFFVPLWGGPVEAWRTEFQMRRPLLHTYGINSVDDLRSKAGGL
ncbi:MAG: hypothetical protein IT440_04510, partial [Phycisphaeraceae bacterium]|nr:hypothetical protein [Phycisphaeraceae bacterium]